MLPNNDDDPEVTRRLAEHWKFARMLAQKYVKRRPGFRPYADGFESAALIALWEAATSPNYDPACPFEAFAERVISRRLIDEARQVRRLGFSMTPNSMRDRMVAIRHEIDAIREQACDDLAEHRRIEAADELAAILPRINMNPKHREIVSYYFFRAAGSHVGRATSEHLGLPFGTVREAVHLFMGKARKLAQEQDA
jgi:RNA polymerase sigma factor (sigma-70 family)